VSYLIQELQEWIAEFYGSEFYIWNLIKGFVFPHNIIKLHHGINNKIPLTIQLQKQILNVVESHSTINELDLSIFCSLDKSFLESIVKILKLQNTVTSLNLSGLHLSLEHLDLFHSAYWRNLIHLNLNNCKIGPSGISGLHLSCSSQLVTLHLASNNLGPSGIMELEKLWIWSKLEMLDLSCNQIQSKGIVTLVQSAIIWKSLKYLSLRDNMVNNLAGKYLIERMKDFLQTLTFLKINYYLLS